MRRLFLLLAIFGYGALVGKFTWAQQLPAPHALEAPAVQHRGGLGRFGGGPDTVAASLDGRIFAMNDGSVWSVAAGGVIGELGKPLNVFYLSAHGAWLAFAEGNKVEVWTLASGQIREFAQLDKPVLHLTGSADETMMVAVPRGGTPELFLVASATRVRNFVPSMDSKMARASLDAPAVFSPDAKLLACGSEVWTVATGESLFGVEGIAAAFTSDGRTLFTLAGNTPVEEWDVATRQRTSIVDLPTSSSGRFTFSPDARMGVLAQALSPNQLVLWDTHAGLQTRVLRVPSITSGYRPFFLGSSDWLIAGGQHAHPQLIRISTGEVIALLDSDGKKNWSVVRTSDGAYDASADALTSGLGQRGNFFVDGVAINDAGFKFQRVVGLLGKLPGASASSSKAPGVKRR